MGIVYSEAEVKQNLDVLLEEAAQEGELRVRRKDGQVFVIVPEKTAGSPLDVAGVDVDLTREEIVGFVHEGRRYR